MNQQQALELLLRRIITVHDALVHTAIAHAFGGAIANAFHGEPRATTDIDINRYSCPSRNSPKRCRHSRLSA